MCWLELAKLKHWDPFAVMSGCGSCVIPYCIFSTLLVNPSWRTVSWTLEVTLSSHKCQLYLEWFNIKLVLVSHNTENFQLPNFSDILPLLIGSFFLNVNKFNAISLIQSIRFPGLVMLQVKNDSWLNAASWNIRNHEYNCRWTIFWIQLKLSNILEEGWRWVLNFKIDDSFGKISQFYCHIFNESLSNIHTIAVSRIYIRPDSCICNLDSGGERISYDFIFSHLIH